MHRTVVKVIFCLFSLCVCFFYTRAQVGVAIDSLTTDSVVSSLDSLEHCVALDTLGHCVVLDSLSHCVVPEDEIAPLQLDTIIVNIPEYRPAIKRIPVLALSTNMLYDLAITPNFAVEFPLGKHWSMLGEYTFPWWVTRDNTRAWQILKWDLGARYWFHTPAKDNPMDVLRGHFLGLDLSAGYYDIEPYHTGWQGEFQAAGLEYGYAWTLGDFWRIEAFIGGGWMGTHYRYYEGNHDDSKLMYKDTYRMPWNFVPIKLGVSIKYVLSRKQRRDGK